MSQQRNGQDGNSTEIEQTAKHLILCEGPDDRDFLNSYLHTIFSDKPDFLNSVQIMPLNGVSKLRSRVVALKSMKRFKHLQSLLVIRDADNNPASAMDNVQGAFRDAGLPVPDAPHTWKQDQTLKIGFLLFPSCNECLEAGALENLCLQILSETNSEDVIHEIDQLIVSLQEHCRRDFRHRDKSRLYTYFATHDVYIDKMRIGRVAQSGGFNWNSPKLEPLKNFLLELADSPADDKDNKKGS